MAFRPKTYEEALAKKRASDARKKKKATKPRKAAKKRATRKNEPAKTKRAEKVATLKRLREQYDLPTIKCSRWGVAKTYTRTDLLKGMLWAIFSKYIRERDADQPCISCGMMVEEKQAGHYVPVGGNDLELCFDEYNVNGECPTCNADFDGWHLVPMRKNMVLKYGEEVVEDLDFRASQKKAVKWEEYVYVHRIKTYLELLEEL